MKNKRGFSLTELIVSITIFVTVITIVIGGIASMSRTKMLISSMKESQQKTRLLTEMLSRFGKEAIYVTVYSGSTPSRSGNRVDYIFKNATTGEKNAISFILIGGPTVYNSLLYINCGGSAVGVDDKLVGSLSTNIASGSLTGYEAVCSKEELFTSPRGTNFKARKISEQEFFTKKNTIPSTIDLSFELYNMTATNSFFDDTIEVKRSLLLENLK